MSIRVFLALAALGVAMYGCGGSGSAPVTVENVHGIDMVAIPGGTFNMGHEYRNDATADPTVNVYLPDEQPVHSVTLSPFQIAVTEVTQKQYSDVMGVNPSTYTGEDYPVTNIGANDAIKFCNKLSENEGLDPCYDDSGICDFTKNGFRLPTEAEWEYSSRAGSSDPYSAGTMEKDLDTVGWYMDNSDGRPHSVGSKAPNAWGIYDMHGNVYEFCYDGYTEYTADPATDPTGSTDFNYRVMRGGGWFSAPMSCRSTTRGMFWTGGGNYYIGFRLARSIR